jgi:hypothetical protein
MMHNRNSMNTMEITIVAPSLPQRGKQLKGSIPLTLFS